jgi:hypothetical protein
MAYPLTDAAREWQNKARLFTDQELIPHEETAEFNNGELPPAVYGVGAIGTGYQCAVLVYVRSASMDV